MCIISVAHLDTNQKIAKELVNAAKKIAFQKTKFLFSMRVDTVVQQENLHRLDADEQDLPVHNSEGFVASGGRTSLIKMCLKVP